MLRGGSRSGGGGGDGGACYELGVLESRWVVVFIEKRLVIETSALTKRCARE